MQYNINLYNSLLKMSDKLIQLNTELENPNIDIKKVASINKQLKRINEINEKFLLYKKMIENGTQSEEILSTSKDDELKEMAQMELNQIKEEIGKVENELKISLLPADPYAERNIIVEMRSAAGGDEASIFVADLFETYKRYSEHKNWNIEIIDISVGTFGYDNIYFSIKGDDVYQRMKFEGGVHRVQRIPATESKGRVHTSTITVSVMPELDEIDIKIRPEDLRIETSRSGGAGGQHVNKVESAIRIVHLPTGIVAACDAERSQIKNKEKAMKMLYARIWEKAEEDRKNSIDSTRKEQVKTGERSEKIRTYNYPQNRITDHRISLSLNKLDYIMQGYLDEVIDSLIEDEQVRLLQELNI